MKLYSSPVAPSPKKVLVFISEKGIKDIEVKDLDIGKMEHKTDEYKKIAPNSRIPALVLDNGDVILETKVSDKDLLIKGNDGGSGITALTFDMSAAGTAIFNHELKCKDVITVNVTSTTNDAQIELGSGRTGNGSSYIDIIGDATYTDYGLRIIRNNAGANASSELKHRGTGQLALVTQDGAALTLKTNNTERMRVTSAGNVGIQDDSPCLLYTSDAADE